MGENSAQAEVGFPNVETLRAIADAASELADVIAKSVVTDDLVCSIRAQDANDLPVDIVLDKLESLLYVDPPSLAVAAEELANRNVLWLTREWPAGWLDHYAVKQAARRLWAAVAGLMVYFGRDPLSLGTWDKVDGKFVRRVMQHVDHPPIRSEVIGEDGSVRRIDEGLSTACVGRLRQHAHELRKALLPSDGQQSTEAAADDSGKSDGGAGTDGKKQKPLQEGQILAYRAAEYARMKTKNPKFTPHQVWEFWTDPHRGLAKEDRDDSPELVGYDPGEYSTFAPQLSRAKNHPSIDTVCYGRVKQKETGGSVVRSKDI